MLHCHAMLLLVSLLSMSQRCKQLDFEIAALVILCQHGAPVNLR